MTAVTDALHQARTTPPTPTVVVDSAGSHRLDIQGLRAVAVLMVVAFHAGLPMPGGFVGVDVFFVISGFVITAMLMREHAKAGRVRLWRFYVRRFKRLTPALAVTVGVVMLASLFLLSPLGGQEAAAKTGLGAMFLAANVVIARTTGDYFDGPAEFNPLLNMWSLSVEEQFYLVFPALMVMGWLTAKRTGHSRMVLATVVGAAGVVSFALAMAGAADFSIPFMPDSLIGFYGPATRVWEFAAGALLALGGTRFAVSASRTARILGIVGGAMVTASLWLITDSTAFPGPWTLLPVIGTVLLLASGTAHNPVRRLLESRTMVAIGDRSYSIYLWHWPFIVFAHLIWSPSPLVLTAAAIVSLVPAFASYRWIEQPMRGLRTERGLPLLRLITIVIVPPVALAAVLLVAAHNNMWNPTLQRYSAAIVPHHAAKATECDMTGWTNPDNCTWNAQAVGSPVYLVGDSNADHFSEGLIEASRTLSRPLVNLTASGCAYIPPLPTIAPDGGTELCADFVLGTKDYLERAEPGLVVLANSYWQYLVTPSLALPESALTDREAMLKAFSSALSTTVVELQSAGHSVILVQTVPSWGSSDSLSWDSCSVLGLINDGCVRTMPLDGSSGNQSDVADEVAIAARLTGAQLLDLNDRICPNDVCHTIQDDGTIPFRDGTHITVEMSMKLAPAFIEAIIITSDPQ